jgi:dipeptidyl aminopeptidase/acylaminoacyl peptidase
MKRPVLVMVLSVAGAAMLSGLSEVPFNSTTTSVAIAVSGQVLAPLGRQAAWLNLEAPRPRMLTRLSEPAYVTDVAATSDARLAVVAVSAPFAEHAAAGDDLYRLDVDSGDLSPLLKRTSAQESLTAPAWWPDGSGILFERDDLRSPLPSYPGEATPRYASRIDVVALDGTAATPLITDARMPAPSPDGSSVAVVEPNDQGTGLVLWSRSDGSTNTIVPSGEFADIAYPRFSPEGDRIAFLVPEPFVGGGEPVPNAACAQWLFAPCVAFAHGLPWNLWVVNTDGSNAHVLAEVQSDDGSLAWSPDGTALLVYGGSGGFVVDATTGEFQLLSYLAGYGSIAWLAE